MVRTGAGVAHLVPKGEPPQLRVILVSLNANFSRTAVDLEVSITLRRWRSLNEIPIYE